MKPRKPRQPRTSSTPALKTLAEYRATGALTPPPLPDTWLVALPDGSQFSIHRDRSAADQMAAKIKGTVSRYTANTSNYWDSGDKHYDH